MKLQTAALSSDHPNALAPRTSSSYIFDAFAMAIYVAAIAVCAALLDVPYPGIFALATAFASMALLNTRVTKPDAGPRLFTRD